MLILSFTSGIDVLWNPVECRHLICFFSDNMRAKVALVRVTHSIKAKLLGKIGKLEDRNFLYSTQGISKWLDVSTTTFVFSFSARLYPFVAGLRACFEAQHLCIMTISNMLMRHSVYQQTQTKLLYIF